VSVSFTRTSIPVPAGSVTELVTAERRGTVAVCVAVLVVDVVCAMPDTVIAAPAKIASHCFFMDFTFLA
jgi:hypothetical protein